MYLAMRITNGAIATLAGLLVALVLLTFGTNSGTLNTIVLQFGGVALFFVADLLIRKRNQKSDVIFSIIWSMLFAYLSFGGLQRLAYENISPVLGGYLAFGIIVFLLYVLPLVLNGTYLSRLLLQKRATT